MESYEYKVIPAPRQPKRAKGLRTAEDRFAAALTDAINECAKDGWEYLRSDTLPCDERTGLLRTSVETLRAMLVFRRARRVPGGTKDAFGIMPAVGPAPAAPVAARPVLRAEPAAEPVEPIPPRIPGAAEAEPARPVLRADPPAIS